MNKIQLDTMYGTPMLSSKLNCKGMEGIGILLDDEVRLRHTVAYLSVHRKYSYCTIKLWHFLTLLVSDVNGVCCLKVAMLGSGTPT